MNTYSAKPHEVEAKWYLIDAENKTLGRLAVTIANLIRGKNKPEYTPHVDMGDFVVVVNADKIKISGKKETDKIYYRYTGYPGGLRQRTYKELMAVDPTKALEKAVRGMLTHNTLGDQQINKLKIYAGSEHPHEAQKPVEYKEPEVSK